MGLKARRSPDPLRGRISVPGDKSISHRAVMLAALAPGRSHLRGLGSGADVAATIAAMTGFGGRVVHPEESLCVVEGLGSAGLHEPAGVIDAGNSGTTLRCVAGIAARVEGLTVLTGDASLRSRPMLRIAAPLRQMGAWVDGRRYGDRAPLVVRGGDLTGIEIDLEVASAQVKTCLLLAGLGAAGSTTVREPRRSRDHTERMLAAAGVRLSLVGTSVQIQGGQEVAPFDLTIPGDISSALYLAGAALLVEGSELEIDGVGLNPTRTTALEVLDRMGARIEVSETARPGGEPVGTLRVAHRALQAVTIDPDEVPGLIDELPLLVTVATQAEGETVVTGAQELRHKESDRIATMTAALGALGADVQALPDGFVVRGPTPLRGGTVASAGDHRVALSMAVAALVAGDKVTIEGWSCVDTSFPEFLAVLSEAQGAGR